MFNLLRVCRGAVGVVSNMTVIHGGIPLRLVSREGTGRQTAMLVMLRGFSTENAAASSLVSSDSTSASSIDNSQYPNAPIRKFFEDVQRPVKPNGMPQSVPVGRPWFASELRGKSFEDLHKLHFILLIERNKLLNEKVRARKYNAIFPSPERLKNVRQSMARLQTVLTERAHESRAERVALLDLGEVTTVEKPELTEAQDRWFRAHRHLKKPAKHLAAPGKASGGQKTRRRMVLAKEFEQETMGYIAGLETSREQVVQQVEGDVPAAPSMALERPRWRNLSETAQAKLRGKQTETRAQTLQRQAVQSQLARNGGALEDEEKRPKWTDRPELAKLLLRRQSASAKDGPKRSVKGRKSEAAQRQKKEAK